MLPQNDCGLITSGSPLQTFDRLEVAEFTARSLIEAASIGAGEVRDLERAFVHLMQ